MRQYDSYRASQPAYVHGSAAPDLRRQGNPDVNVMPGRRNGVNHAGVPESIFGVVSVVFAVGDRYRDFCMRSCTSFRGERNHDYCNR